MAAWGGVVAWTGFEYSAVDKSIKFTDKPGNYFWSNGHAWGTCAIAQKGSAYNVNFSVLNGQVELSKFTIGKKMIKEYKSNQVIKENENLEFELTQ